MIRKHIRVSAIGDSNCYEISLDVPGMDESDLSIDVKDDVMVIKDQKEERSETRINIITGLSAAMARFNGSCHCRMMPMRMK